MHLKNTKIISGLVVAAGIVSAQGVVLTTPGGTIGTIGYTFSGDVATVGDEDLLFTTAAGGSFTITFTAPVDIMIFNSTIDRANNFDDQSGALSADVSAITVGGSTGWSYAPGAFDLTAGTLGDPPPNAVAGLGTDNFTIGNGRIFEAGPGVAGASNALESDADWGAFSIVGATSLTYNFSNNTNIDSFRIDAVTSTVPEPSAFGLLGLAALGLGLRRRR